MLHDLPADMGVGFAAAAAGAVQLAHRRRLPQQGVEPVQRGAGGEVAREFLPREGQRRDQGPAFGQRGLRQDAVRAFGQAADAAQRGGRGLVQRQVGRLVGAVQAQNLRPQGAEQRGGLRPQGAGVGVGQGAVARHADLERHDRALRRCSGVR